MSINNQSIEVKQAFHNDVPEVSEGASRTRSCGFFVVFGLIVLAAGIAGVTFVAVPNSKPTSSEAAANEATGAPTASPVARITAAPTQKPTEAAGVEDCNQGQKMVEFFIQLDQDSNHETGWMLQCTNEEVWNVPVGILEETKENREGSNQIRQSACVDDTETCEFVITDSYGDGLVEGEGYFYLRYGATTVAQYDMSQGDFSELVYCFGPNCEHEPVEVKDECAKLYLAIGLDAYPEELSYEVVCNDEVILKGPWGDNTAPFDTFEEETCLPMDSCCRFTVTDSGNDGLTASQGGDFGWIYLEYGLEKVYGYTGDDDGAFSEDGTTFGYGCQRI